ncbi:MAG: methyltransferase domain-containing protein [Bdellovibrionales bacterium]|nr:methyltransferase domain-containing protein [Bdellovibrionales bacterium]
MSKSPRNDIALRFSGASKNYDAHAEVHHRASERLIELLPDSAQSVLEVGCGTGVLTRRLLQLYPQAELFANDISREMINHAKRVASNSRVQWVCADYGGWNAPQQFDLIASNAAFHWITPYDELFRRAHRQLVPQGKLGFSIMVKGTLGELHRLRRELTPSKQARLELPTSEEIARSLEQTGFLIEYREHETANIHYTDALAFIRTLHEMGVTGGEFSRGSAPLNRRELTQLLAAYQNTCGTENGGVYATFELAYFIAAPQQSH